MRDLSRLLIVMISLALLSGPAMAEIESLALDTTNDIDPLNWPAGTWYVRAIQRDASDATVGVLTAEISFILDGEMYPSIEVTMSSTAPDGHDLLFMRSLGVPMVIGDSVQSFAFNCSGSAVLCSAAQPNNVTLGENLTWVTINVPGIFGDGFETGLTNRWSSVSAP